MDWAILQIIAQTASFESCLEVGHHVDSRTHYYLRRRADFHSIFSERSELVFDPSFKIDFRYIPPIVNPEDPEIRNSENTVLFLISCYQYIMIAVILSVGPPYREPMLKNSISPCDSADQFLLSSPFQLLPYSRPSRLYSHPRGLPRFCNLQTFPFPLHVCYWHLRSEILVLVGFRRSFSFHKYGKFSIESRNGNIRDDVGKRIQVQRD